MTTATMTRAGTTQVRTFVYNLTTGRLDSVTKSKTDTTNYTYHANQRVFVRGGNTVTYHLYGMGGERLTEFQEACAGGACSGFTETQRWIYFAGRKMFSKTGSTLKAITPNRLTSEARHFPYGKNIIRSVRRDAFRKSL